MGLNVRPMRAYNNRRYSYISVEVPTVERGLRLLTFCSMAMAGGIPLIKTFYITTLSLSIKCVECQGGFTRTGQPGDDNKFVSGYFYVYIFQVVDACAFDEYGVVFGHNLSH